MARSGSAVRSTTNGDLQHCSVLYNCAVFVVQRHRTHMFVALVWAGRCEGEWCRMIKFFSVVGAVQDGSVVSRLSTPLACNSCVLSL